MRISDTGCWIDREAHYYDRGVADGIARLVGPGRSLNDLGCGDGSYVRFWREREIEAYGYDGSPATWGEWLDVADLAEPLSLPVRDWVTCLEVGEHIPAEHETTLVDNLDAHNSAGLVVSWARPGQGGRGHVNEKRPSDVVALFEARDYVVDVRAFEAIRRRAELDWFKVNLFVFRRR